MLIQVYKFDKTLNSGDRENFFQHNFDFKPNVCAYLHLDEYVPTYILMSTYVPTYILMNMFLPTSW